MPNSKLTVCLDSKVSHLNRSALGQTSGIPQEGVGVGLRVRSCHPMQPPLGGTVRFCLAFSADVGGHN